MITLFMIVAHILRDRVPKQCLSEEDHPMQTLFFYGTDKSFRERVQVWGSWRQSNNVDTLPDEYVTKFVRVFRIAVEIRYRVPRRKPSSASVMLRAICVIHELSG
jgi:hypothetical protein